MPKIRVGDTSIQRELPRPLAEKEEKEPCAVHKPGNRVLQDKCAEKWCRVKSYSTGN
jgi:hypothetical protein